MARRLDRRVVRTRKLLRDAMMELILEEGYDAISTPEILLTKPILEGQRSIWILKTRTSFSWK